MKRFHLRHMVFLALCCDLGLFSKSLISPLTNLVTDTLHIPGGVATAFSLMFLVIASATVRRFGSGTAMGAVQSMLAVAFGKVGSMGALSPLGYILPGFVIDIVLSLGQRVRLPVREQMVLANAMAAVTASLTANWIVFRLSGAVLVLYLTVSCLSGWVCGILAGLIYPRLCTVVRI